MGHIGGRVDIYVKEGVEFGRIGIEGGPYSNIDSLWVKPNPRSSVIVGVSNHPQDQKHEGELAMRKQIRGIK